MVLAAEVATAVLVRAVGHVTVAIPAVDHVVPADDKRCVRVRPIAHGESRAQPRGRLRGHGADVRLVETVHGERERHGGDARGAQLLRVAYDLGSSNLGGRKWVPTKTNLAESERGVWFWLEIHGI